MTLIYITIAWTLGIVAASLLAPSPTLLGGLAFSGVAVALWGRRARRGGLWGTLILAAALGGWRYRLSEPALGPDSLAQYNERGPLRVYGVVSAEPSVRATYTQLELAAREVELAGQRRAVRGKVVLNVPHDPAYEYGDLLGITGTLETPPVLGDFSYREYLAARGVHSLMRRAQVAKLGQRDGSGLLRALLRAKSALRQVIEDILPQPEAGLLSGILLGLGHTLPTYIAEAFRLVGLTHILVISGFNVGLVAQAIILGAQRLIQRWAALVASLGAIALYALFVGLSPPVARAALMGGLVVGAQLAGRRSHALTGLAAASLVMTAADPLLLWSVSFQLSFVATLALLILAPALERGVYLWMVGRVGGDRAGGWSRVLRDVLLVTLAAQLMTLPLIWYHFREVSLVSLLANALVLPVQPAIMALGAGAVALGALWLPMGRVAAWLAWPLLRYSTALVQRLAALPWASAQVPPLSPWALWGFYALLFATLAFARSEKWRAGLRALWARPRTAKVALAALGLVAALTWAAVFSLPDGKLHVYFLDVGQGDAILLRTPSGRVILVDGGPDPLVLRSRLGEILPFWQRRIDLVISTHADKDHAGGLEGLGRHYRVGWVLEGPRRAKGNPGPSWAEPLVAAGAQRASLFQGMRVELGKGLRLEVLHPPPEVTGEPSDDNRDSVVLRVVMGRCRLLLTADIDTQVEGELLAGGQALSATVLKVAHHGAATSSSAPFLAAVNPQVAVIGVGQGNRFGHPSEEVLRRLGAIGCQVYRTDLQGTIELVTDGRAYWLRASRGRPSSS